jgi:hypothetical protein
MNPETEIEIEVLLELRDYLRANYWFLFRRFKLILAVFSIPCIVFPLLLITGIRSHSSGERWWGYLIPWAVVLILFVGTYFNTRKQMASNKGLSERVRYLFSVRGIDLTAASFSGSTAWQNVYEANETGTNFLIFLSKSSMYIVPKRCFRDVDQMNAFKRLLRTQLESRAKWK